MSTTTAKNARIGDKALVIGASMSGLLAARVLTEHFEEVILLERDRLPEGAALRKGTPQAGHAHGMLAHGLQVLEELFPGFTDALCERGATLGDIHSMVPFLAGGRRFAAGTGGVQGVAASRALIESQVRMRVRTSPRVKFMTGVDVLGLRADPTRAQVTGVRFVQHDDADHGVEREQILNADLVIDCSGRGSHSPKWLQELGYEAPQEQRVTVGIGYVTAYFKRDAQHAPSVAAVICSATAELPRPGVLLAQEPGDEGVPRWVVTMGGYVGDHVDPTLEGMRERAHLMRCPELIRVTHEAEMLGTVKRFGFPHSQRRRYEKLARFPRGYLVFGDALSSFNPVYGQGMTVAACEAMALRAALAAGLPGLHRRFFIAAAKVIDVPWQVSVGADLAIDGVPGPRPAPVRLVNQYMMRVFRAAQHDPTVALAFLKVMHMLKPPPSLFAPGIIGRVLWAGRRSAGTESIS